MAVGWKTLAEPIYGISVSGDAMLLPAGLSARIYPHGQNSYPPGAVMLELGWAQVEMPHSVDVHIPAELWYVTASSLRFKPTFVPTGCAQCSHPRDARSLYAEDGDDEPWSFCSGCGGQCEFVAQGAA